MKPVNTGHFGIASLHNFELHILILQMGDFDGEQREAVESGSF